MKLIEKIDCRACSRRRRRVWDSWAHGQFPDDTARAELAIEVAVWESGQGHDPDVAKAVATEATMADWHIPNPEFDAAISQRQASFAQLAEAHMRAKFGKSPLVRITSEFYEARLMQVYAPRGTRGVYWCDEDRSFKAGVVLTHDHNIDVVYPALRSSDQLAIRVQRLLREGEELKIQTNFVLKLRSRKVAMGLFYSSYTDVLYTANLVAKGQLPSEARVMDLEAAHAAAADYARVNGERLMELWYFLGMLFGIALFSALAASIVSHLSISSSDQTELISTFVSGGVGGALSIMVALAIGQPLLKWNRGILQMFIRGLLRPLIGAGFGVFTYVLTKAGLIPLRVASDPTSAYSYAGLAYLAGFSPEFAIALFRGGIAQVREQTTPRAGDGALRSDGTRGSRTGGRGKAASASS